MRDWSEIDAIYNGLLTSVYPQPDSQGHTDGCGQAVSWFLSKLPINAVNSVFDMGAGTGFAIQFFQERGIQYSGCALGKDVEVARSLGRNIIEADFNFLPDGIKADAILSRHSLEHSPFPHLSLISWRRIASRVFLVLPALEWFHAGVRGTNHFSVLNQEQWEALFNTTGWKVVDRTVIFHDGHPDILMPEARTKYEYWFSLIQIGGSDERKDW